MDRASVIALAVTPHCPADASELVGDRYRRAVVAAQSLDIKAPGAQAVAAAASMSGAFAITRIPEKDLQQLAPVLMKLFGPMGSETRKANDIFDIVDTVIVRPDPVLVEA